MDPIFPLMLVAAIAGASWLGFRATRTRFRSADPMRRLAWKIVCHDCSYKRRGLEPDCQECRSARMQPLSKYQALGGGTGFWIDKDGPFVSSLCEGEWKPSDSDSNLPQGHRHAPLFDLDFPATWTPSGRGGRLVALTPVPRAKYLGLLEVMERLRLVDPLTTYASSVLMEGRQEGVVGYRAPGSDVLAEAAFQVIVPAKLVPSSTEGRFHLYLETEMDWQDYLSLMRFMVGAGLLEKEWVDMSERRKMAMLRKPGILKHKEGS